MERLMQDLRYAVRSLLGSPAFTIVAALTLALGIGANTAIFSVLNAVLLRPLAYAEPGRLVTVKHFYPTLGPLRAPVSVPGFRDYSARTDLFEKAAIENNVAMNLTGAGDPERIAVTLVSGEYFQTFGVAPLLGRMLRPDEAADGHNHVAVLSYGFWKDKYGSDRAVIGRSLALNGESYEIVGVMPATFKDFFSANAQLFTPIVFQPRDFSDSRRTNEFLQFTGRLRAGVSLEKAQTELHAFAIRLRTQYTNSYAPDWDLQVTALSDEAVRNIRTALYILLGAVGFVLLIACANVANLQLARTAARGREIAVRVALGASPRRLVRQLLTESVLLALLGGGLGVVLAIWGVPALLSLNARNLPPAADVGVDGKVLLFALLVSVGTGLLFGLMPAIQVARGDLHESLKEGGRGAVGQRSLALRRGLVVTTVALALTLLVGAGLLIRSFARVIGVEPGFRPDHLLTFAVSLPRARYGSDTTRIAVLERLEAAIAAVPGVSAAGGTSNIPFGGNFATASFAVEGYQAPANAPGPWGDIRLVTPGFLPALGATLLSGRLVTAADRAGAPRVAVVDDRLAQRYWPHATALGKRITYDDPSNDSIVQWVEVVGVVGHTAHEGLDADPRTQVYLPLAQRDLPFLGFVVRTAGSPTAALPAVRAAVRSVDDALPLANVNTMETLIEQSTGPRRFSMLLLGVFAGVAMILASIGLYGVMSYSVTQRARELGVRVALGADSNSVLGLVLGQGVRLALAGVGIGLVTAFAVTRLMRKMLFNVSATDPLTFVVISLLLIAVALLASYLPARRATRVDPIVALRAE
jgi:predicted permease